jgi:uncharacterized protein (DUF1330 family)
MATYAVGIVKDVEPVPQILEYLERIDATLAPYGGHFILHGGNNQMFEGTSPGTVVVIEFPDHERAEAWYGSPAYQAIIPLRAEHSDSTVFLLDGVDRDHRATDVIAQRYAHVNKAEPTAG